MTDAGSLLAVLLTLSGGMTLLTADLEKVSALSDSSSATVRHLVASRPLQTETGRDGRLYLDASLNGTRLRFLVDTAASHTVVSLADARRTGVRLGNRTSVLTAGGKIGAYEGFARTMTVDGVELANRRILVVDGLPRPLLGIDTLKSLDQRHIAL